MRTMCNPPWQAAQSVEAPMFGSGVANPRYTSATPQRSPTVGNGRSNSRAMAGS